MTDRDKEFLRKLKELMEEYNASVGFTCSDGSDTYGLYDDHLEICINEGGFKDRVVFESDGWWIESGDIRKVIE